MPRGDVDNRYDSGHYSFMIQALKTIKSGGFMIQANISEVKNRLSYYLKLVRGGEEIEILDRKTPLAKIVHVSKTNSGLESETPWIQEAKDLGLITSPSKETLDAELLNKEGLLET
ncbi:MAG: type II toxin-antitoxin system Phd/YefM family antitoxin, partial [Desulfovermiculus sp.]